MGFYFLRYYHFVAAKIFLVFSSLFFYAYWKFEYLFILLISILCNYCIAQAILKYPQYSKRIILTTSGGGGINNPSKSKKFIFHTLVNLISPKILLIFGIIFNLSLLGFFKYTDFFLENFNLFSKLLHLDFNIPLPHIVLPLALSFVTFQKIALLVDCYSQTAHTLDSKKSQEQDIDLNFVDYCLFVTFFPQLIAGPIVHHREVMPQFHKMEYTSQNKSKSLFPYEYIAKGSFIFIIGLFKKVCIADSFSKWANEGFDATHNGNILYAFESWASSLSYTFQLYFDFSGYCDMAIGLALLFGIALPINFNSPYKALNIAEFWRKWHITLGRFLKSYVYIPLGGNQNPKYRTKKFYSLLNPLLTLRNLFIVAFLSGVWHGAGWGFVIWGVLHGLALVTHRIYTLILEYKTKDWQGFARFRKSLFYKAICLFVTFNFVNIAWVFFRSESLEGAYNMLCGMFGGALVLPQFLESKLLFLKAYGVSFDAWAIAINSNSLEVGTYILGALCLCLCFKNSVHWLETFKPTWKHFLICAFLFFMALNALQNVSEFLYFNF